MNVNGITNPDFVVVGARQLVRGGRESAMLIASNRVRRVDIEVEWDIEEDDRLGFVIPRPRMRPAITLKAELRHFGQVWAPTYAEAWERLMNMANPDEDRPGTWGDPDTIAQADISAIMGPQPELPPGT